MRHVSTMLITILLALLAIPLMAIAAAFVTFNTPQGRYVIEVATEWVTRGTVRLEGLSGRFPDRLRLRRLSIRDRHGAWLVADAVALDWSPLQFIHGRARVERLTAQRIAVLRAPSYPATRRPRRQPEPQTQVELPFTVQLDQLTLPEVDLSAALAGNATALRIDGGGFFRSLQQAALQLRAQRLDRQPSAYSLALEANAERVQGRLDLQEDANGPLTNLVGLPELGALSVHLALFGPLNALATTLDARAGPLRAQANGTLDLPALAAELSLNLEAPAMTPRPGLSWRHVSMQAQSHGSLIAPSTSAQVALDGLSIGSLQLESLQAALTGQGRGLSLDATLTGLRLPAPVDTLLAHAPIRLNGQAQMVSANGIDVDLTLTHPLLQAQAHYELGAPGSSLQASKPSPPRRSKSTVSVIAPEQRNGGTLVATIPQLGPWALLAQLNLQGRGSVTANLAVQKDSTRITLSTDLQLRDGDARYIRLLGPRAQFGAAMTIGPEQIQLERAQLSSSYLTASAHGTEKAEKLDIAWQAALSSLDRLSSGLSGPVSAQGHVQGTLPRLSAAADLNSDFSMGDQHGTVHVLLEAQDLPQHPSGRLQVSGALADAPLSLLATVRSEAAESTTLALEHVDWKSVHGEATLHVDGDLLSPDGAVTLRVTRLQDLAALLGEPIEGAADARLLFDHSGGRQRARLTLNGRDISMAAAQLTTLQLRGEVNDPFRSPRLALQLSTQGEIKGTSAVLSAQANGPMNALALALQAHTEEAPKELVAASSSAAISLAGSRLQAHATWNQARQQLKIDAMEAHYRDESAHLAAPALISFQDGITIEHLRLQWPPALIQMHGRLTPQLDLRASVHNFNPGAFGVVMPLVQAQGHTDIELDLHGELSRPTGSVTLMAGGISATAGAARGLPPAALKISAQLSGGAADVNAALTAGSHMQLRATGTVPLQRSGSVAMHVTGAMDLAVMNPILEASGQRVLGQMSVEAQLAGTLSAPQARGSLTITHGEMQDYPRGLHITDLSARVAANGSQLSLSQFNAHAAAGTLSATGSVDLSSPGMPVQLELTAQNAEPLKSDLLTASVNADLKVAGAMLRRELVASGTVKINKITINIPNALPPDVQTLDVVRPGQAPPPPPPKPLLARMDLTLDAPRGVFVRGRGLNAELGGRVHIAGTSSSPSISGGFDLINGIMDISGATLTFNSGRVSFNGTGLQHKIDPTIDFVAKSALGGGTATLEVSGYADAPVITLSSSQGQPPDQILSQLLFGENVSQLSALQAAGIASALVTLSGAGGGGGLNPLNTVQRALGLNRLVISSSNTSTQTGAAAQAQTNTGVTIQAGRYISNRVYVGAKQSTNGLTQAQVQVDITRSLKVQTTLSTGGGTVQGATPENDPGSSVGVSYSFQY